MGGGDPSASAPTGGGLLEQTQNAIAQRKAALDNAGAMPAPVPPQGLLAPAPKGIRPNFVALDPKQWTPEEHALFKAQNQKPSMLQQILNSMKK